MTENNMAPSECKMVLLLTIGVLQVCLQAKYVLHICQQAKCLGGGTPVFHYGYAPVVTH